MKSADTFTRLAFACALGLALSPGKALAGSLSGEFTFADKPPSVALVYFKDMAAGGKLPNPEVDQKNKKFTKKMVIGSTGSRVTFKNNDDVEHNIFANDPKTGVSFDVGLVPPTLSSQVEMSWKEGMVVKIGCKIHPKMQSYIANLPGPYYAIVEFESTDRKGTFKIDNVPDKLSAVSVWFPKNDPINLTLKGGETKTADVLEKGKAEGTLSLTRQ